jgi:hypothetical protein
MPDHHTLPEVLEQVGCCMLNPIAAGRFVNCLPSDEVASPGLSRVDYCDVPAVLSVEEKDTDYSAEIRVVGRILANHAGPQQVNTVFVTLPDDVTSKSLNPRITVIYRLFRVFRDFWDTNTNAIYTCRKKTSPSVVSPPISSCTSIFQSRIGGVGTANIVTFIGG